MWCGQVVSPVVRDQPFLLPPDMREWLPADHVVWVVLETVEALDTTAFHAGRRLGGVGAAGYDPDMLLALLIYAYCQGVRSSRQIERRCLTDVAFRVVCAQDIPDHATLVPVLRRPGTVLRGPVHSGAAGRRRGGPGAAGDGRD